MQAPGLPVGRLKTAQGWMLPSPEVPPASGGGVPSPKQEDWIPAHRAKPSTLPELQNGADLAGAYLSTPDHERESLQVQIVKQSDRCALVHTPLRYCTAGRLCLP